MQKLLLLFSASILLFYSCAQSSEENSFTEITIDDATLILSAETNTDIARPSSIRAVAEGFYLYDFGLQQFLFFNRDGEQQFSFGAEGQGPGEFQGLGGFWIFDDQIAAFDQRGAKLLYYSLDGNFLNEEALAQENFAPGTTMNGPHQLVLPLNGKDGKLAKFTDIAGGTSFAFGDAEIETPDFDAGEISQAIERGNLPDFMLGRVSVAAGSNQFYLFHSAIGKLQAFDDSGNLMNEITLDLPVMSKINDEFYEHSRTALERGFFILFSYIHSIVATENGVTLLLNSPEDHPVTILTLDNSLENLTAIYYDLDTLGRVQTFDIDESNNTIYFVNMGTSEIFSAPWAL